MSSPFFSMAKKSKKPRGSKSAKAISKQVRKKTIKQRPSVVKTRNAAGVRGFILRLTLKDDDVYFRVYLSATDSRGVRKFIDYRLEHYDLEVTISKTELATLYSRNGEHWLDYPDCDYRYL
jgi:hypothetical protein